MKNIDPSKNSANQASPDNQGILLEKPKDVDEAAAEANRDIAALLKIAPKKKTTNKRELQRK